MRSIVACSEVRCNLTWESPAIPYWPYRGNVITQIGKAFSYEDLEYEIFEYQGIKIKIGTPETLYKLKKDTVRTKDKSDAIFLKELINDNKQNQDER